MVDYVIEGKIAVITGCTAEETEIIIPEKINEYRVCKIKENSFFDLPNLTKVIIPKYVKVIGAYAFSGCKSLTNVTLAEGVETIEDWAFSGCGITTINLPKSLKFLGANSFLGSPCKSKIASTIEKRVDTDKQIHLFINNAIALNKRILDHLEDLNVKTLDNMNHYCFIQLNSYERNKTIDYLDLPFVFNNSEFVLSFYTKNTYDRLRIVISDETISTYGNYDDNNEDYILAKLNILNDDTLINNAYVIIPFCDSLKIEVEEISYYESDENNIYLLTCKASMKNLGSGNCDREFALNVCEVFRNKYKLEFQQGIIPEEHYIKIDDEINMLTYNVTKDFILNIKGAPLLSFVLRMIDALMKDKNTDLPKLNSFIIKKINYIYHNLSDYTSLEAICFNLEDIIKEINESLNIDFRALKPVYGIDVMINGSQASFEDINKAKDDFVSVDDNYDLYIKELKELYKGLREIAGHSYDDLYQFYLEFYSKD